MTNGILTREALLALAEQPDTKTVEIPELKGSVKIRTAPAQLSFEIQGKTQQEVTLLCATACLVDGDNKPIYTASTVHEFLLLPTRAAERIMSAINDFNGWSPEARAELEKNSQSQGDDSASDSPSVLA